MAGKTAAHETADAQKPVVLSITPVLPVPSPAHAGGQYVWQLHRALETWADPRYLVGRFPSNEGAADQSALRWTWLGEESAVRPLLVRLSTWWSKIDVQHIYLPAAWDLLRRREVRDEIRRADVLDFQWAGWTRLAFVRRLNRSARLVMTFHDVPTQITTRRRLQSTWLIDRLRWRVAHALARLSERRALQLADAVVVFSEKDRLILDPGGRNPRVAVVAPPLGRDALPARRPPAAPTVLFLSFLARPANADALHWLAQEIWPLVTAQRPDATLRVVGAGLSTSAAAELERVPGISYLGFIDDLESAYEGVTCAVVPLRDGAGVKFKTIEAMLRGIPVVTTTIGAEGIAGAERLHGLDDTAEGLASAVLDALNDPEAAFEAAALTQTWAAERFGVATFDAAVRDIYRPLTQH
ncbi:hypothetical protein TESS_TESS_00662 [Tessaracoccus sp. O5.2]|uniref:glycosyltransferase family 4 protein n=1 Tax=Tessaracoccus sp. O5.2 TaxID=3157622 RepID=UPI0035EC0131